jgi:hypothetical protein
VAIVVLLIPVVFQHFLRFWVLGGVCAQPPEEEGFQHFLRFWGIQTL